MEAASGLRPAWERTLQRASVAMLNVLVGTVGIALYVDEVGEPTARLFSIAACLLALASVFWYDSRLSNWMLWVQFTFFAFYAAGSLVGLLALGGAESFLDYPTTFANTIAEESRVRSYIVSGVAAVWLAVLALTFPPKNSPLPRSDPRIEQVGLALIALSTPFVVGIHLADAVVAWRVGYAAIYSAAFSESRTVSAFASLWTNASWIGFILVFSSIPLERRFRLYAVLFLLLALLDSLKGARILFIVPLAFFVWFRARAYGHDRISRKVAIGLVLFASTFVFALDALRQQADIAEQNLVRFAVFAISKAQYGLALYIDNKELVDAGSKSYWAAPLLYPITYLSNRASAVGQSESSAGIRADLGHVLASKLNREAYLAGAGTGSTMVAEAYQYGLVALFVLLAGYYVAYREFFGRLHTRFAFAISIFVFQHVMFSPRDTMFPNMWGVIKLVVGLGAVWWLVWARAGIARPRAMARAQTSASHSVSPRTPHAPTR
jgi:hypothetical protein